MNFTTATAAAAPIFQEVFVSAKDSRLGKLDLLWKKITGKPESGESTIHFTARFLNPDFKGDDQAAGELVLKSLAPSAPLLEEVAQAVRRPGVCWPLDYSKGFETPLPHLPDGLRGERASILQLDVSRTDLLMLQRLPDTRTLRLQDAALRAAGAIRSVGWFNEDKAAYIDAVNHPKELPSTLAEIETARAGSSVWNKIRNPLSHQAMPAILGVAKTIAATQTTLRSLATACAIERYRMAHGRLPATLENLVPAFLPSVPTDPLTGKPLCYKPSESSSYLIYGTGWDQTDNAGSSVTALTGLSSRLENQADWGVLVKF